jgi:hypothetical protein
LKGVNRMKRVVAVVVMSVLAVLGFTGTASALTPAEEELFEKCEAEFEDALDAHLAGLDDVEFAQFEYDWNDLWTQYEKELISDEQLIAGLDEITGGLFSEFLDCLDSEEPKKPDMDKPAAVPTSVPAGYEEPDTGAGVTAALVGLGLAAAAGLTLLARRAVNQS